MFFRSYTLILLILLIATPASAWNPMTVTSSGGAAAVSYDLNITFDVSNDTCADTETIGAGSPSCGTAHGTGSLTVVDTSTGTVEITGNQSKITGSGAGQVTGFLSGSVTRELGKTLILETTPEDAHLQGYAGVDNANALDGSGEHIVVFNASAVLGVYAEGAYTEIGTYAGEATQVAIVLGGYDDGGNGIPWESNDAAGSFEYGASIFAKSSSYYSSWTLLWKTSTGANTPLYPQVNWKSDYGIVDDFRIPTSTLESLLQPNSLDTFTGTNGQTLESGGTYSGTDVMPSGETTWHKRTDECAGSSGDSSWTIDTNTVELSTNGTNCTYGVADRFVYLDTSEADFIVDVTVRCDIGAGEIDYVYFRGSAETAAGENAILYGMTGDGSNCDEYIYKLENGGFSALASDTAGSMTDTTQYALRCITDGNDIDCFMDGTATLNASNSFNATATRVGLYTSTATGTDKAFDNFAVFPRGTGGEYSDLDSY